MAVAGPQIVAMVQRGPMRFCDVAGAIMETYMLRETNAKDLVVQLASDGKLENTWGGGRSKPSEDTIVRTKAGSR